MSIRTITLSDRPPVSIKEDDWPIVAEAKDKEYDNQYECQANRKSIWNIRVRQHEDGRSIIYATYSYQSNWANSRDYNAKHGEILTKEHATPDGICLAIKRIANRMSECECDGNDNQRWQTLADECIADLPAEQLI